MSYRINAVFLTPSTEPVICGWIHWAAKRAFEGTDYHFVDSRVIEIKPENIERDLNQIAVSGNYFLMYESEISKSLEKKIPNLIVLEERRRQRWELSIGKARSLIESSYDNPNKWLVFPKGKLAPMNTAENLIDDPNLAEQGLTPLTNALILSLETFDYYYPL